MSTTLARRLPTALALPSRSLVRHARPIQSRLQSTVRAVATEPTTSPSSLPPPRKKRGSWRGTFLRWGAAGGAVWWYMTSPVFAEEPEPRFVSAPQLYDADSDDEATVAAIVAKKRAALKPKPKPSPSASADFEKESKDRSDYLSSESARTRPVTDEEAQQAGEEAQGAFNPETGEINWDCPCLGGMAYGPCGDEFKAAFSCFVYSKAEPKGMDCIDKFQGMQTCFRAHPEVYADELRDDEPADDEGIAGKGAVPVDDASTASTKPQQSHDSKPQDTRQDSKPGENNSQDSKPQDSKPSESSSSKIEGSSAPKSGPNTSPIDSVEDLDRRVDARELKRGSEEEEGRRVNAIDASKIQSK